MANIRSLIATATSNGSVGFSALSRNNETDPLLNYTNDFQGGGVGLENNVAYVTDYSVPEIKAYDVSTPTDINMLGEISLEATQWENTDNQTNWANQKNETWVSGHKPTWLHIKDGFIYIQDFNNGIVEIIDGRNPTNMYSKSIVQLPSQPIARHGGGLKTVDNTMIVATIPGNIHVVDISDKTSPEIVTSYNYSDEISGMDIDDEYIYIADSYNNRVAVLEIPVQDTVNPSSGASSWNELWPNGAADILPSEITDDFTELTYIQYSGEFIFTGRFNQPGMSASIQAYSIEEKDNVLFLDHTEKSNIYPTCIENIDNYIYVGTRGGNIMIFSFDGGNLSFNGSSDVDPGDNNPIYQIALPHENIDYPDLPAFSHGEYGCFDIQHGEDLKFEFGAYYGYQVSDVIVNGIHKGPLDDIELNTIQNNYDVVVQCESV